MDDTPAGHAEPAYEPGGRGFSPLTFLFGFGIGAFVGVAVALAAVVITNDDEPRAQANVTIEPDVPVVDGTVLPTPDSRPKTRVAQDVRLGPGTGFAIVGLLARAEAVEVVGRDDDSQWLAIRFPPGSVGRGWIPVSSVDAAPELARLPVALPTPLPRTIATFPTGSTGIGGDGDDRPTNGSAPTRTPNPVSGTPTPRPGPPDLAVTQVRLLSDRRVSVTVANRGPGDLVGFTVFVQVRDLGSRSEMISANIGVLRVGSTVVLETSTFLISGEQTIQAIADPFGSVQEEDRSNNSVQVVLAVPLTPTATATREADLGG